MGNHLSEKLDPTQLRKPIHAVLRLIVVNEPYKNNLKFARILKSCTLRGNTDAAPKTCCATSQYPYGAWPRVIQDY